MICDLVDSILGGNFCISSNPYSTNIVRPCILHSPMRRTCADIYPSSKVNRSMNQPCLGMFQVRSACTLSCPQGVHTCQWCSACTLIFLCLAEIFQRSMLCMWWSQSLTKIDQEDTEPESRTNRSFQERIQSGKWLNLQKRKHYS